MNQQQIAERKKFREQARRERFDSLSPAELEKRAKRLERKAHKAELKKRQKYIRQHPQEIGEDPRWSYKGRLKAQQKS